MWAEIYSNIKYFLALSIKPEVFWNVFPLILCTILIIAYFSRYKNERAGWETYFSNSLVLIFVSINLFRYIYNLDIPNAGNYFVYSAKSIAVLMLLSAGALFMKFNFSHWLPERYARIINSPLSINSIAYIVILYVYSTGIKGFTGIISLLIILIMLILIFEGLKFPLDKISILMEKEKEKERFRDIKEAKLEIDELNRELKARKKELKDIEFKRLEKEKKTAIKLERALRK